MDWKDHIIEAAPCHTAAQAFIPFAGEDFLVTLANKGLYKRALKDIEATSTIRILPSGEGIEVTLDTETVTLSPHIAQSTCSCPSRTVCKHILMGIIATAAYASSAKQEQADIAEEIPSETTPPQEDWQELKEADIAQLRKQAGKKLFDDTLRLIQNGWTADFTEGEVLQATINTENITLYFPRRNSLSHAICKCGKEGLCKHKLIAILSWLSRQGILTDQPGESQNHSFLTEETHKILTGAFTFLQEILLKGINLLGEHEIERAIQYSIRMEAAGIGNLSRLFRILSTDIENMLNKHVGFDQIRTYHTISRLYNTIRLIRENSDTPSMITQLVENSRSDYYSVPVGHFTALGAAPWQTRSGYVGITVWFFHHEKQTICSYTISLADYYSKTEELATYENLSLQFEKHEHWDGNFSLAGLSSSLLTLRNFKLNKQNRLSSSAQTQGEITGKLNSESIQEPVLSSLFTLPEKEETGYQYFEKKQSDKIVIYPFTHFSNTHFDTTTQKLRFTLAYKKQNTLDCSVSYSPFHKNGIRKLERIARLKTEEERHMICLRQKEGYLPIALITLTTTENIFI